MKILWNCLNYENTTKINITKYAHLSGTGIMLMNTDIKLCLN
jgi:hypothetical protein